jgi:YHS domain-containing protein
MGTLLYFLVLAGFFFLMMRFGCGAHVMGHGDHRAHRGGGAPDWHEPRWVPPETVIDPVCRISVRTDSAKSSVYQGTVYYFCSVAHRDAFEAAPERYVGAKAGSDAREKEHSHG